MFVIWRSRSWALAILLCEKYTWALTREWALSVHLAKMGTWALTREWALARETTVLHRLSNQKLKKIKNAFFEIYLKALCHDIRLDCFVIASLVEKFN